MLNKTNEKSAREQVQQLVAEYYDVFHNKVGEFKPGSRLPYASRVYDSGEMVNLLDSALEFWLTAGRYANEFETKFAAFMGVKHCALVNSGSLANL